MLHRSKLFFLYFFLIFYSPYLFSQILKPISWEFSVDTSSFKLDSTTKLKFKAYKLQEECLDSVEANEKLGFGADLRDYGVGAQILKDLGATKLTVLTNNPKKLVGLEGHGLEIISRLPIEIEANQENKNYLNTKKNKLGHILNL